MSESNGIPNRILVEHGLIHADGGLNALMVSAASGTMTVSLVDALWANHHDMDVISENVAWESGQVRGGEGQCAL